MGTLPLRLSIREPQWAQVLPCLPWHAAGCCTMRSLEAGGGLKEPRAGRVHSQPAVSRPFQRIIQAQTHLKDSQWPQILRGELQSPLGPKAVHLRGLRVPHSPLPTRHLPGPALRRWSVPGPVFQQRGPWGGGVRHPSAQSPPRFGSRSLLALWGVPLLPCWCLRSFQRML